MPDRCDRINFRTVRQRRVTTTKVPRFEKLLARQRIATYFCNAPNFFPMQVVVVVAVVIVAVLLSRARNVGRADPLAVCIFSAFAAQYVIVSQDKIRYDSLVGFRVMHTEFYALTFMLAKSQRSQREKKRNQRIEMMRANVNLFCCML